MKPILKFTTALLCLQFLAITTFAQVNQKAFIGVWELSQAAVNGQAPQNARPGLLKMFNSDGTFVNVQALNSGSIISHSGNYTVNDAQYYSEKALYRIAQMSGGPLGKDFKIKYEFSEDKKWLTLNFTVESGIAFTETWRRL